MSQLKVQIRKLTPRPIYEYGSQIYRGGLTCARHLRLAMKHGVPDLVLFFGYAPGDDLLCTTVLHELKKRSSRPLWIMSRYPELFMGVSDSDRVVPVTAEIKDFAEAWGKWRHLIYAEYDADKDQSLPPKRHILAELCARAGVSGQITLRPYYKPTDEEKEKTRWASGFIAIQSSGLSGQYPMRNKQWFPERLQEVVSGLKSRHKFVQVGSKDDPALADVVDLRGKTSIRETAALLANCRLYVGNVGFLMHLARAVECPSAIVFGGREAPWQSGYSCNVNIFTSIQCAPCWRWNTCEYDRKCMSEISSGDVIRAVEELLDRVRNPLAEDSFTI